MGFYKTFLLFLAAFQGISGISAEAFAAAPSASPKKPLTFEDRCKKMADVKIEQPSEIYKRKKKSYENPCPYSDGSEVTQSKCFFLAEQLEERIKALKAKTADACGIHNKITAPGATCEGTACHSEINSELDAAKKAIETERAEYKKLKEELKSYRKEVADQMVEPTKPYAADKQGPVLDPGKQMANTTQEIDTSQSKISEGNVTDTDISKTKEEITREQLAFAQMIQTIEKQIASREKTLDKEETQLNTQKNTNQSRQTNGQSHAENEIVKNTGPSGINGTENPTAASKTDSSLGSLAAMAPLAGPAAALAAQGQGSPAAAGGADYSSLGGNGATPSGLTNNYATNSYESGGSTEKSVVAENSKNLGGDGKKIGVGESEKELAALNSEEGALPGGLSSSSASRQSLKDSLRARLAGGNATGAGGQGVASATGASVAPGGGGSNKDSAKAQDGSKGFSGSTGSLNPDIFAGSGSAAGLDALSTNAFDLAGSETDAFVQNMVGSLSADFPDQSGRGLASVEEDTKGAEILAENSASLFSRTRETHNRCVKKGLLLTNVRAKL